MGQNQLLALAAVVAAIILWMEARNSGVRIGLLVATVLEALLRLGILHLDVRGVSLHLILGAAIAILGVMIYLRVGQKTAVTCATLATTVGGLWLLAALGIFR